MAFEQSPSKIRSIIPIYFALDRDNSEASNFAFSALFALSFPVVASKIVPLLAIQMLAR